MVDLIYIIITLLVITGILGFLYYKKTEQSRSIVKQLKITDTALTELKKEREEDIIETNKLFLEKSENEIQLFFEFEAAVTYAVKLAKETLKKQNEIIKLIKKENDGSNSTKGNKRQT